MNATRTPVRRSTTLKTSKYLLYLVGLVLIAQVFLGESGVLAMLSAQEEQERLTSAIRLLREENEQLRQSVKRLTADADAIEVAARSDLGLMKEDEVQFVVGSTHEAEQHDTPRPPSTRRQSTEQR